MAVLEPLHNIHETVEDLPKIVIYMKSHQEGNFTVYSLGFWSGIDLIITGEHIQIGLHHQLAEGCRTNYVIKPPPSSVGSSPFVNGTGCNTAGQNEHRMHPFVRKGVGDERTRTNGGAWVVFDSLNGTNKSGKL